MRIHHTILLTLLGLTTAAHAQTAEELVAKNLAAKGGIEKIRAITNERMVGRMLLGGFGVTADIQTDSKAPDLTRQTFTIQGMSQIVAYDGKIGWQISPFQGRKDPEMVGDDDLRDLVDTADFYGPLVDYKEKGNTIAYVGHDTIDGDDVYKLRVTIKNGDVFNYYLDPDSMLEVRVEHLEYVNGAVHDSFSDLGSYKLVNGVYFPFSVESGSPRNPENRAKVTFTSITANVEMPDDEFKMPAAPAVPSPQKHAEPPAKNEEKKPPTTDSKPPAK